MQTRRQFLRRASGAAAVAVVAPQSLAVTAALGQRRTRLYRGGSFAQGVLSGEPTPNGITLLTLLDDVQGAGSVVLEVARDDDFRRVVTRKVIATRGSLNHSVKARVTGLRAGERYYYRFETANRTSPAGRFQTALPADSNETVRFAFFSCSDYTHGFYNAYELLAREDDIDFVLNLGDYIYADTQHTGAKSVRQDRIGRVINDQRQAVTLADYRAKYALYRRDASLRKMHSRFPMISIWDDHEADNNYAGGAPNGGLPANENFGRRQPLAYKAFFESMPVFPTGKSRIYRNRQYGRTLELILLDERQHRADQPCGDAVAAPDCPERTDGRDFLGDAQMAWAKDRLTRSPATWKVIGNQVPIMPLKSAADRFGTFDTWQGYVQEREELVNHIRGVRNVVFATGDFHIFMAGDVRPGESADPAATVAPEFHSGSITSESLGEGQAGIVPGANDANPNTPQGIYDFFFGINPWLDAADVDHHGYGVMETTTSQLKVRYRRLRTIKRRGIARLPDLTWTVAAGSPSIKGQAGKG